MFKIRKYFVALLVLIGSFSANLSAQNNEMMEYENGFAYTLGKGFPIQVAYFFGPNNSFDIHFGIMPYNGTQNLNSIDGLHFHNTQLLGGLVYYYPIAAQMFNNQFFLGINPSWSQTFGRATLGADTLDIKSRWTVRLNPRLHYRFNPKVYFTIGANGISYTQTKYKLDGQTLYPAQKVFKIFSGGFVELTYKF